MDATTQADPEPATDDDLGHLSSQCAADYSKAKSALFYALGDLRESFHKADPGSAELMTLWAEMQMNRALSDCCLLDIFEEDSGASPKYLRQLEFSSQGATNWIKGICAGMWKKFDSERREYKEEPNEGFRIIYWERLKGELLGIIEDGQSPEEAMKAFADSLGAMAGMGHLKSFIQLGRWLADVTTKPQGRDLTNSIARAWLPLRLWRFEGDSTKAEPEFIAAMAHWDHGVGTSGFIDAYRRAHAKGR